MLNLAILFSLVVILNLGNSVESGVAVENKIDTRLLGELPNHKISTIIRKYYNLSIFNLLGK